MMRLVDDQRVEIREGTPASTQCLVRDELARGARSHLRRGPCRTERGRGDDRGLAPSPRERERDEGLASPDILSDETATMSSQRTARARDDAPLPGHEDDLPKLRIR